MRVFLCVFVCFCHVRQLLTAKEVVYLVNLSKRDYLRKANKWLPKIQAKVEELGGGQMIPFSVEFEQEVRTCCGTCVRACRRIRRLCILRPCACVRANCVFRCGVLCFSCW